MVRPSSSVDIERLKDGNVELDTSFNIYVGMTFIVSLHPN